MISQLKVRHINEIESHLTTARSLQKSASGFSLDLLAKNNQIDLMGQSRSFVIKLGHYSRGVGVISSRM